MSTQDELGTCDTCQANYELASRDGRCGDCGDCANCCNHDACYECGYPHDDPENAAMTITVCAKHDGCDYGCGGCNWDQALQYAARLIADELRKTNALNTGKVRDIYGEGYADALAIALALVESKTE